VDGGREGAHYFANVVAGTTRILACSSSRGDGTQLRLAHGRHGGRIPEDDGRDEFLAGPRLIRNAAKLHGIFIPEMALDIKAEPPACAKIMTSTIA